MTTAEVSKLHIEIRDITREEIIKIWAIDRGEVIENTYSIQNGKLILKPDYYDMKGWPSGESEHYTPILIDCFNRGGTFLGAFQNGKLIGIMVLDNKFIGTQKDSVQLKFLYIDKIYRKQGLGVMLFNKAVVRVQEMNAAKIYISATPSENTVNFYLNRGCVLAKELDRVLFELEPKDIHLEYAIP
mgnify:CR=1 FL=1